LSNQRLGDPNAGRVFDWQLFEKFLSARPRGFAFDPVTVAGTRGGGGGSGLVRLFSSATTCSLQSHSFARAATTQLSTPGEFTHAHSAAAIAFFLLLHDIFVFFFSLFLLIPLRLLKATVWNFYHFLSVFNGIIVIYCSL
jgi:hypothetical protein